MHSANYIGPCRRKIVRICKSHAGIQTFSLCPVATPIMHHSCFLYTNISTGTKASNASLYGGRKTWRFQFATSISHISEMIQESMAPYGRPIESQNLYIGLSNDAVFNDLEQPIIQFSRSRHSLMLDVSQTAKDTGILLQNANRKKETIPKLSNGTVSMTLSDV